MALPETDYASIIVPKGEEILYNNLLYVDLSNMKQAWWDTVNTTEGPRGRAAKDSGEVELPTDWIEFNQGAQTGFVCINWTGQLFINVDEILRIYPPTTSTLPLAKTDPFGSDECYDPANVLMFSPNGGNDDRSSNGFTLTEFGGVVSGGVAGKIGSATDYNGTTQYVSTVITDKDQPLTMMAWSNSNYSTDETIISLTDGGAGTSFFETFVESNNKFATFIGSVGGASVVSNLVLTGSTWNHSVSVFVDETNIEIFSNSVGESKVTSSFEPIISNLTIGGSKYATLNFPFDGQIQQVFVFTDVKSQAWINYAYQQTNDNAGFWGEWSFGTDESEFCNRAVTRLIEQFDHKDDFKKYLCALITPFDDIKDMLNDLQFKRNLDNAEGVQLDGIGDIVGLARGGLSDDDYRVQIRIKIVINASNGETESVIAAMLIFAGGTFVDFISLFPAGFILVSDGTIPSNIIPLLEQVAQAGVRLEVYATYGEIPFAFDGDSGDPPDSSTQGFSEPNYGPDAGLGGSFVEKFS